MVYRKKQYVKKRSAPRKTYNKKKYNRRFLTTKFTGKDGLMPNRMMTVHPWCHSWQGIASNAIDYQYRGNSLFDPDYSGTGTQPLMFDQIKTIYGRYRIIASSIKVTFTNIGGNNVNARAFIVPTYNTTSPGSSANGVCQQKHSKERFIGSANGGHGIATLKHYMTTSRVNGLQKRAIMSENGYAAEPSTNPVNSWFWNVMAFSTDGSASLANIYVDVKMKFYTVWSNPAILGLS